MSADPAWLAGAVALAAAVTAAIDAGVFGELIPIWRRQVDDQWLARYRNWVYGAGFGWQIGVGVATYIMTAAVFLVVLLAALTGNPVAAVALCGLFGLARGLAVLLTARADSPAQLRALHRRFDQAGPAVRVAVIAVQAGVAIGGPGLPRRAGVPVAGRGYGVGVTAMALVVVGRCPGAPKGPGLGPMSLRAGQFTGRPRGLRRGAAGQRTARAVAALGAVAVAVTLAACGAARHPASGAPSATAAAVPASTTPAITPTPTPTKSASTRRPDRRRPARWPASSRRRPTAEGVPTEPATLLIVCASGAAGVRPPA